MLNMAFCQQDLLMARVLSVGVVETTPCYVKLWGLQGDDDVRLMQSQTFPSMLCTSYQSTVKVQAATKGQESDDEK